MRTSIIILNWNTLDYLRKCVNSIKEYTTDYELIIIDNCSTEEGTKEYIKNISEKIILNPENLGFSQGNNQGAKRALGEYLCFINNDCVVHKGWLEDMIELFNKQKNVGAVGPLANPESSKVNGITMHYPQHKGMYEHDTPVLNLIGFCILIKKELFEKIGGWDEDFKTGNYEDNYLSELIKKEGKTLWISFKSKVDHLNPGRTFEANNLNYLDTLEANKKIFEKKMGELNAS